jgi:hypothetical protein
MKGEGTETERESTRSHYLENSLWKRLWTCRKRDDAMSGYSLCVEEDRILFACYIRLRRVSYSAVSIGLNNILD